MKLVKPKLLQPVGHLAQRAIQILMMAGFKIVDLSPTGSIYLRLPGRQGMLRVSCHSLKRQRADVLAMLTFKGHKVRNISEHGLINLVTRAMGQYVLRSAEPPSWSCLRQAGAGPIEIAL